MCKQQHCPSCHPTNNPKVMTTLPIFLDLCEECKPHFEMILDITAAADVLVAYSDEVHTITFQWTQGEGISSISLKGEMVALSRCLPLDSTKEGLESTRNKARRFFDKVAHFLDLIDLFVDKITEEFQLTKY